MSAVASPRVAVVVPARGCAGLLPECVSRILAQTRPPDEIILSVGPSNDGTEDVARQLAADNETVRVVQNPAGDRGSALNAALSDIQADLVAMVDAQSLLDIDYLEAAARAIRETDAAVVGGPMRPRGRSAIGRAMASALRSPFGVGDSQFHFQGRPREAESVYLGVYRRSALRRIGAYNPGLLRTEDDDMNARIRASGMRIWLEPSIRSTYLCRNTLSEIWAQYYGYGYWKVALATVRHDAIRIRQFAPAVFVLVVIAAAAVSLIAWWPALLVVLAAYLVMAAVAAIVAPADGVAARLLFVPVAMTMHIAYGIGSLVGLSRWRRLAAAARAHGADTAGGSSP